MQVFYENFVDRFLIRDEITVSFPAHIHAEYECFLMTRGELELRVASRSYTVKEGDFAIVFPEMIHSYYVPEGSEPRSVNVIASPSYTGSFMQPFQTLCPEDPVIPAEDLHEDVRYALFRILETADRDRETPRLSPEQETERRMLREAYLQVIIARCLPCLHMIDKKSADTESLLYRAIYYITKHFQEPLTLTGLAKAAGCSPYALSRMFSGTLNMNFNQYLNGVRLDYAAVQLRHSADSITDICFDAGFESQRTFNRAFHDRYGMSPRKYRAQPAQAFSPAP